MNNRELNPTQGQLVNPPPYSCAYCGMPSWYTPDEQPAPVDYCHEGDHGSPELLENDD